MMRKMIASGLALLLFLLSGATTAFAAEDTGETPSGIACTELEEEIDKYIDVRKDTTSSVSVAYFNETEDIASVIYGEANTAENIKADEETVYEWGSISKVLVWTSVMQLYEQGKIDLDEDVRNYLPDGFLSNLSYDEPVTMTHLMNHTAGFQETTWDVEVLDKKDIISLRDALLWAAPPQIYKVGTTVSYSNWGAALAAYIVECVSGMDYAEYVRQNIFEPLGMNQTSILPDCSDNEWVESRRDLTNAYYNVQGEYEDYGACRRYILLYPAGAATGTMSDLVRFAKAFLADSEDCPLFTKADTLAKMLSPTLYYDGTDTPRICHGMFSQEYGVRLIGHAGNTTGFSANLVLDRENRTGLVIMTNEVGETTYNYGLVSLIFGDCRTETGFSYDDLSGIYCNSRANYSKSFLKLFSMISGLLPVTKGETQSCYQAAMAGSITQISENACIMDDGNGLKTYLHIKRNKDGNVTALQHMMGMDFQKENTAFFIIKIIFFFLFVISSFWVLIMLIVHGITLHKYKHTEICQKKRHQLLSEVLIVITSVLVYWLIVPPLTGGNLAKAQVIVKCVLIILCTLMEMVMLLVGWFGVKNTGNTKNNLRQKIGFTVTKASGILLVISVLYWHFYQFWGC